MAEKFVEIVFEGHYNTVKGYIEGFLDGMGKDYRFYFSSDWGIDAETLREHLTEWISLGDRIHHVIMEEGLSEKIKKALAAGGETGLMKSSSIRSRKSVDQASFHFSFEAYGRKYAEEIKKILSGLPEGITIVDYEPREKIDAEAKGVELYTPAHDYIFEGKGTIRGPVDLVIFCRKILGDNPLVETGKATLVY